MDHLPQPNRQPDQTSRPANPAGNAGWSLWCGLSLVLWGVCATLGWSQDGAKSGGTDVLLLENNRVVMGKVKNQGDSYAVEQAAGTLIIGKDKVIHATSSLHSAYVYLQDSLPKKATADDHVELARWCIGYKLISEARFELEAALEQDPSREDIRRNLNKMDALFKKSPPPDKPAKSETLAERLAKRNTGSGEEVESLGGLSREAGREFTRHIQPILMHNCTASACHGPKSDNKFKLTLVRQGAAGIARGTTEKNLLALFPYIDRESPKSGALYKLLKTNHGAQGRSIFLGTKGKEQVTAVQDWLKSLSENEDDEAPLVNPFASKIQQTSHTTEQTPRWRKGGPAVKPAAQEEGPAPAPEVLLTPTPSGKGTAPRSSKTAQKSPTKASPTAVNPGPDVESIVSSDRPVETPDLPAEDPFDPGEFNRLQRVKRHVGQ